VQLVGTRPTKRCSGEKDRCLALLQRCDFNLFFYPLINTMRVCQDPRCIFCRFAPKKDLTRYGVEPNPGPPKSRRKRKNGNGNGMKPKQVLPKVNGRGGYGYAPGLLGTIGTTVGGYFAGPVGGYIGKRAGDWLGKITGMGDYKVSRNSLVDNGVPQFKQGPRNEPGAIELCHTEFLQDISSSVAFTNTAFPINPGLNTSFPFLSQIAVNFEEYEFLGLVYSFKSTSATAVASTNTSLGVVILSTNYDTADENFSTKQQMEAYQFTVSTVPSASVMHPVECDPRQTVLSQRYVRATAVPSGFDQRFYDLGNFQIATVGSQAAAVVGELWVSYHVRFYKPRLQVPLGQNLVTSHFYAASTTAAAATPLGTSTIFTNNTLGVTAPTTSTFVVPLVGRYLLRAFWSGGPTAAATLTPGANITLLTGLFGVLGGTVVSALNSGSNYCASWFIDVATAGSGAANTITVTGLTAMAAGNLDMAIVQVSSGYTSTP
jgi:hypothetical protein